MQRGPASPERPERADESRPNDAFPNESLPNESLPNESLPNESLRGAAQGGVSCQRPPSRQRRPTRRIVPVATSATSSPSRNPRRPTNTPT